MFAAFSAQGDPSVPELPKAGTSFFVGTERFGRVQIVRTTLT